MSRTISFTVTDDSYEIIRRQATSRGLRTSAYVKSITFTYIAQHPVRGIFADLYDDKVNFPPKTPGDPCNDDLPEDMEP